MKMMGMRKTHCKSLQIQPWSDPLLLPQCAFAKNDLVAPADDNNDKGDDKCDDDADAKNGQEISKIVVINAKSKLIGVCASLFTTDTQTTPILHKSVSSSDSDHLQ